jgi:hypothetical protein
MEAHPQVSSDNLTQPKKEVDHERSSVRAGLHTKPG